VAHPANASHERGDSASLGDLVCLSRMRKRGWHHLEKSFLLELVPMRCATCLVVGWGFGTRMPCSRSTAVASLTLPDSSMMISSSLHRSTMTIGFHQLENGASSRPLFASGASGPFPRSFPRLFAKRFRGGGTRPPAARIRDSKGPGRAQDTPGRARRAAERCHIGLERSFPFPALELVARQQTKSASAGVRRAAHTHTERERERERGRVSCGRGAARTHCPTSFRGTSICDVQFQVAVIAEGEVSAAAESPSLALLVGRVSQSETSRAS
jgi:hypothetical protein